MSEEKKSRKPDKRKRERPTFVGFPWDITEGNFSMLPNIWIDICASIENLAELKVVLYVMRHTWGFQEYGQFKRLTVEEFVNGRKRSDGSRMDLGTGLSERSVINGIALAIQHGMLVCDTDDRDKARVKKAYMLKMQEAEELIDDQEPGVQIVHPYTEDCAPLTAQSLPRSENELIEETLEEDVFRNTPPSENNFENIRYLPVKRQKYEGPLFIKQFIEDFSRDCGDAEHTTSNITRAYNIYKASGSDPDVFQEALYSARDGARKATIKKVNSKGRPNRMPYFFKCLEKSLGIETTPGGLCESN